METFILSLPVGWGDGVWELGAGGALQTFTDGNPYPQKRAGLWWEDSVHRASLRRGLGADGVAGFFPRSFGVQVCWGKSVPTHPGPDQAEPPGSWRPLMRRLVTPSPIPTPQVWALCTLVLINSLAGGLRICT